MKPYLTRLIEAFIKEEYNLKEVNIKLASIEANGKPCMIKELMKHASTINE
jgi:hypothetical protein